MKTQTKFENTFMINVPTPDGSLWVHIVKNDDGSIHRVFTSAGKCGASFNAWAAAYANLISIFINEVVNKNPDWSLARLITELSGFVSDRTRSIRPGIDIKSGPEGMVYALRQFQQDIAERTLDDIRKSKAPRFKIRLG